MKNKTNIYGDYKICIKCKNPSDVVEGSKIIALNVGMFMLMVKALRRWKSKQKKKKGLLKKNEILNNIYIPIRMLSKRLRF